MNSLFIVVEGTDGSGKGTQAQLLRTYLQKNGVPTLYLDFPQYDGFFGKIIAKYLRGEFGSIKRTSPYLISIVYALDRATKRAIITAFRKKGGVIVANRYVPSNVAHQCANIVDVQARSAFMSWIQRLEYTYLRIPKEDLVIYLDLPWKLAMKKSEEKASTGLGHDYLKGKDDIHEVDEEHRRHTAEVYEEMVRTMPHWRKVSCVDSRGVQLTPENIHQKIVKIILTEMVKNGIPTV